MSSKNHYHPVVDHILPSPPESEPARQKTGSEIGADIHTNCICMPIMYWIFVLAIVHVLLIVISLSTKFFFIFETVLIVFSVLIVFFPDTFHVFVHFLIQLVLWIVCCICYICLFVREVQNESKFSNIVLLLIFLSSSLFFTIIYVRLVVASR